jgi:hypothetical protein
MGLLLQGRGEGNVLFMESDCSVLGECVNFMKKGLSKYSLTDFPLPDSIQIASR